MSPTLILAAVLGGFLLLQWFRRRAASAEAHRRVEAGATLVDVRTPAEFAAGHLPGAVNVPMDQLVRRWKELGSRDRPLVVYCRSGSRSSSARALLEEHGYENVFDLGPMSAW